MLTATPPTPESAYAEIERRVKKFKALSKRERDAYNEDNTRKDFIMPLFRALGWDVADSREVAAEEKVSRGRVDFSFRIGGVPRFFLETKRISEDLTRHDFVQQAINYAWTKGVTWSLLSDFEGLRVFNAEWRESDPLQAQFLEFGVDTYLGDFERLWWLSRVETESKRLDREAEKVFKKTPRTPIARSLFDHLLRVRKDLYDNFKLYNKSLFRNPKLLDDAVQRMLDRLIFIRTAEDREVEPDKLIALVRETPHNKLLPALYQRFRDLDDTYNSQLFASSFMDGLDCQPSTMADVIEGLYHSKVNAADYAFDAIDADVLGRVYEQYLGYIFSEQQELEAKRAKRKSQGIYYTPTFVVKYIVQQTLGRYLEDNGYNPSHPVRVLDPACGSGSFLIEAFDVLDRFVAEQRGQTGGRYEVQDHARQVELLTQCIYGVDKDEQAVEVARLNLMLKALHSRDKLPMLKHIAQGDSLISGTAEELEKYFGEDWKQKLAFDWHSEFREAMKDGGFDVIVGNPPYVRIQTLPKDEVAFYNDKYAAATGSYDIYVLFVERALQLLRPGGVAGFILPNKFMQVEYGIGLREILSRDRFVERIVGFGQFQVFEGPTTYTCLLFLRKQENPKVTVLDIDAKEPDGRTFEVPSRSVPAESFTQKQWSLAGYRVKELEEKLANNSIGLLELPTQVSRGSSSGADDVFILTAAGSAFRALDKAVVEIESGITRTPLYATDFGRYEFRPRDRERIIFPYKVQRGGYSLIDEHDLKKQFPKAYKYLGTPEGKTGGTEGLPRVVRI